MRFRNMTLEARISYAIFTAEKLLDPTSELIKAVWHKDDWQYDTVANGYLVSLRLVKVREPIQVFFYTPWNPFTRAIGYFNGENEIHLNKLRFPKLTQNELIGLLLHEYSHYCGFTHGNNYKTEDKCLYSVPYYLSENVTKWM